MEFLKFIVKSMLSGFIIGIGCTVFLLHGNKTIGAVLFSFGLISICELDLPLFTGRCGYVITSNLSTQCKARQLFIIWISNYIGAIFCAVLIREVNNSVVKKAITFAIDKTYNDVAKIFILGILCGILMYIAVFIYNKNNGISKFVGILFCVPIFILCGFEHSIANMFYLSLTDVVPSVFSIYYILVVTAGNIIGGVVISITIKLKIVGEKYK